MYNEIYEYVKGFLAENNGETSRITHIPFRKRSEHTWRVFQWTKRLIEGNNLVNVIDTDSLLIAALFHDIGYALLPDGLEHAENSANIFNKYAFKENFDQKKQEFISYLISNHSKKFLLNIENTPLELIILMEADLLDETGALSIVFDCLMEGSKEEGNFHEAFKHIKKYSCKILDNNPMKTDKAKEFWTNKQKLLSEFVKQLEFDLAVNKS